jgi:hypothetical protein
MKFLQATLVRKPLKIKGFLPGNRGEGAPGKAPHKGEQSM